MPLFHEETDTAEFDQFMQNIPRESVSVCGKTYKCQSTATGDVYWSSDPKSNGHSSRECNVDMLAAAAHANNCNVSRQHKSIPSDCLRENPILADAGGKTVQVRDDATYDMPSIVEAHWRCVAKGVVHEGTHDPSHVEDHGGVALLHLKTEAHAHAPAPAPALAPAPEPAFAPAPEPAFAPAPAPAFAPAFAPASAPAYGMTAQESSRAWTTCSIPSREQKRACSADHDCPIMDARLNDMLLTKTRELNIDMSKGLHHFIKSLRNTLSPDLEWTSARAKALEGFSKTEAGVKSSIGTLLSTDETFRHSVRHMIEGDPDFSALRESSRSGSCTTQGKCMSSTVLPTSRLYDGNNQVTFSMLDEKVMYSRNGIVREAEAIKCTGDRKKDCNLITDVVEGGDSLSLTGKPMAGAYRLRFAGVDSEYMVMNNVNVQNEAHCLPRLCEHNTMSCPSSICKLTDEKTCVSRT